MHPNPSFRKETHAQNLAFARERSFGVLTLGGADGPLAAHIPFVLNEAGNAFEGHLVRSNPIARALDHGPLSARIAVNGPDGYISPDWYGVPDQVPTWNYVAVHVLGDLVPLRAEDLRSLLDRQSAHFEGQLEPKKPWHMDKMSPDVADRMMRQIRPFRLQIERIESTWKLGQNKPDSVRDAAAKEVGAKGMGQDIQSLSRLMTDLPNKID